MKKHLIFDLDGTLIDSAPSILGSYAHVFESKGITPQVPFSLEMIGPPLMQTLAKFVGSDDVELLNELAGLFKLHYDTEGYKDTLVYAGIDRFLKAQQDAGYQLYIATNKRHIPTTKIIQHLGWSQYFAGVFALDSYAPPLANKGQMLAKLLGEINVSPADAFYIGDRYEDGVAAGQSGLIFLLVNWGYFDETVVQVKPDWQTFATIDELGEFFRIDF